MKSTTPAGDDPRLSELTTVAYVYAAEPGVLSTYSAVIRREDSDRVTALLDDISVRPGRAADDSTEGDLRASQVDKVAYITTNAPRRTRVRSCLVPYSQVRRVVELIDDLRVA